MGKGQDGLPWIPRRGTGADGKNGHTVGAFMNDQKPVVSAVIPTRNRPELVCRAVRSVLSQTVSEIECIVVIDGLDAATVQSLSEIADSRLRVIALPGLSLIHI